MHYVLYENRSYSRSIFVYWYPVVKCELMFCKILLFLLNKRVSMTTSTIVNKQKWEKEVKVEWVESVMMATAMLFTVPFVVVNGAIWLRVSQTKE